MRQLKISKQITNRESLNKHLQVIGKADQLTAEDEVGLTKRIKNGDHITLEKLIKANLRFMVFFVTQYLNHLLDHLTNEGNPGLIKATQRFDQAHDVNFASHAVRGIRQSIIGALPEQSSKIPLPLKQVGSLNRITNTFSESEQQYVSGPSNKVLGDIGQKFNLMRERARQIKEKAIKCLSNTSHSKMLQTYLG